MRKLIVSCQCGQRMQVPRSAIGRIGMCPTCGQTVEITPDNTRPLSPRNRGAFGSAQRWWRDGKEPAEEDKRQFGRAVDLYGSHQYGEALAIFNALARQFPGNAEIESGRARCVNALRNPRQTLALEHKPGEVSEDAKLDAETVKRVVLEKLLYGRTESVQLQAAALACKILGLEGNGMADAPAEEPAETDTPPKESEADFLLKEATPDVEDEADETDAAPDDEPTPTEAMVDEA